MIKKEIQTLLLKIEFEHYSSFKLQRSSFGEETQYN